MNPLDDLISSSAGVRDPSPASLDKGRAVLDAAIASEARRESPARRKASARWSGFGGSGLRGPRGKVITGLAGVAAVAAAAAIVIPSSAAPTTPAGPGAPVTVKTMTYKFGTTASATPAAIVLDAAATAIGKQAGPGTEPNVDWSAPYFHTVTVGTCNGTPLTNNTWETRTDDGAGLSTGSCDDPGATSGLFPITLAGGGRGFYRLGNQSLTEKQVDALPTDPAKLWPVLERFRNGSLPANPSSPDSNESALFQSIWNLIISEPLSPAFREALLKDAAKIPGVSVEGKYTDSLGRTGTVLHIGVWTMAIDTSHGQILAAKSSPVPGMPICTKHPAPGTQCQPAGTSTQVYASQRLVSSVPKDVASTIVKARGGKS